MAVVLETTIGDITIDLYVKYRPRACLNFLKLCKVKYYNFCTFHKIERNFIAQTGDPTGTGRGGESVFSMLYGEQAKYFDAEVSPRLKHQKLGTVSMVNNGDDVHGSQFFITLGEDLDYLDGSHTVFAEVTEGLEVLTKLNDAICDEEHRPYQDILITHTVILDDPFDDPPGLAIPDRSPEPTAEHLQSSRIGATEDIDDAKGKSMEELEEEIKSKEAKARATILEMIGDIPDAEVKPPDTVLFVCKLNPVTTAEDLEVIFSRFGIIKSCEVICDKKTGESLQYAFIEFEKPEDCENAYFKMDNVLIDDRRIHVDFSQSVSKLKWKGRDDPKNQVKNKKYNYVLKEKAQEMKDERYDMVFESDYDVATHKSSKINDKEKGSAKNAELLNKKDMHRHKKRKHKKKHSSQSSSDPESLKPNSRSFSSKHTKNIKKEERSMSSDAGGSEDEHKVKRKTGSHKDNSSSCNFSENHHKSKKKKKKSSSSSPNRPSEVRERSSKPELSKKSRSCSGSSQVNDTMRHSKGKSEEQRSVAPSRSRSHSKDRHSRREREQPRKESASISDRNRYSHERSRRDEHTDRRNEKGRNRRSEESQYGSRRNRSRTPERRHSSKSNSRNTQSSKDHPHRRRRSKSRASRSSS